MCSLFQIVHTLIIGGSSASVVYIFRILISIAIFGWLQQYLKYKLCTHITKCDLFNASLPCPHCCSPLCTGQACSSTVHCPPLLSTDHCAQCTCALLSVVLHSAHVHCSQDGEMALTATRLSDFPARHK